MVKNTMFFIFLAHSFFACQEQEDPNLTYGDYFIESMVSAEAMDVIDNGVISEDLFTQIKTIGKNTNSFFLTLFSPENFNVSFSQITFNLPQHFINPPDGIIERIVILDRLSAGRKFEKLFDGSILLDWNTSELYDNPNQLGDNLLLNRLLIESQKQIINFEAVQNWYDYSLGNWKEVTVRYQFKKR